jgi:hypothetical protein
LEELEKRKSEFISLLDYINFKKIEKTYLLKLSKKYEWLSENKNFQNSKDDSSNSSNSSKDSKDSDSEESKSESENDSEEESSIPKFQKKYCTKNLKFSKNKRILDYVGTGII